MAKNKIRAKVRRKRVAQLAAYSRRYTVKHSTISTVEGLYQVPWDTITNKLSRFNVGGNMAGKYYIKAKDGSFKRLDHLWKHKKYPQPKCLKKEREIEFYFGKINDLNKIAKTGLKVKPATKSEYPDYTLPKMNHVEYMEKLVEHKLAKWERKHPKPCPDDDLFKEEYLTKWYAERDIAKERFRDFVVSIYDKLPLTGRFQNTDNQFLEEPVADIKDVNMEGYKVNELDPKKSKLIKKAQKITNETKAKKPNLVATNLKDHKRKKGRIILPQAA